MLYLYLFITFFEIGLFGFGGGYGMLSLIQSEVVYHWHWISIAEFTDIVAISQMTPGPVGINSATYCGYTAAVNSGYSIPMSILGSFTATFALVLPSLILMILISKLFMKYMKTSLIQSIFTGLRPAVVAAAARNRHRALRQPHLAAVSFSLPPSLEPNSSKSTQYA